MLLGESDSIIPALYRCYFCTFTPIPAFFFLTHLLPIIQVTSNRIRSSVHCDETRRIPLYCFGLHTPNPRLQTLAFAIMKVFSSNCTFDYSWNEVSTANWRKYCPWNDKSTHVVGVDTLSRSVDSGTGIVCFPASPQRLLFLPMMDFFD